MCALFIVPGFGGSRLQAKLDGKPSKPHWICDSVTSDFFEIWLNLQLFTPLVVDCFVDNMKMIFNTTTRQCVNNIGVEARVKSFGTDTDLVEWLDTVKFPQAKYFATIADALVSWGYVRGESLRAAPFDWRLKPTDLDPFYNQLKALIQQTSWNNNNQKVVLIGHSMGNIHVNYFLRNYVSQAFRDRYIQSHVAIAAPWS
uniref:Lecithin-cholesterol acyltransferase n=1 Tax=Rhabditophanes sp. KR3021 TaxID=114890 RepID=A0AC35U485_9BILA